MKSGVFAFAGPIGSGKTSLALHAATVLGASAASFSAVLADIARSRGFPVVRDTLQQVGVDAVETSPRELCRQVLEYAHWKGKGSVVIDGLRHRVIAQYLEQLVVPVKVWIVYVDATFESRRRRVVGDAGIDALPEWDSHPAERHVSELQAIADLVVTNEGAIEHAKTRVNAWLTVS